MIHTHSEFNGQLQQPSLRPETSRTKDFTAVLPEIERTLAEHDAQIRELQQAVVEVANAPGGGVAVQPEGPGSDQTLALGERIALLESRMVEQDRMIRHTLTMLIEWIETQGSHPPAV